MGGSKEQLLAEAVDYVASNGVSDLSLRRWAEAIGTSHRMLIYHFGSREGLLVEVIRIVEQRQRDAFTEIDTASTTQVARTMWRRLADPSLWPHERLFFELYGQALQGRPGTTALLPGVVTDWLTPVAEAGVRNGAPPEAAMAVARLGLAVVRGLLLDLLATGDCAGVDAAMELFLEMHEALGRAGSGQASSGEPSRRAGWSVARAEPTQAEG
jgi:AcrR family transcriptional regulator